MCHPGNQTIYRACWVHLLEMEGVSSMTNKHARELLRKNGGCVTRVVLPTRPLDKLITATLR